MGALGPARWDNLTTMQQWMCEQVLGIEPAAEDEKPPPRRTQADKWAMNYEAAKQFFEREGHLRVPRKHIETIATGSGEDQEVRVRWRPRSVAGSHASGLSRTGTCATSAECPSEVADRSLEPIPDSTPRAAGSSSSGCATSRSSTT